MEIQWGEPSVSGPLVPLAYFLTEEEAVKWLSGRQNILLDSGGKVGIQDQQKVPTQRTIVLEARGNWK